MKIIGAGLSKTGTKSLNAALTILGYKVFDYFEHTELFLEEWKQLVYGKVGTEILKRMYKDADAAIAFPVYLFWEEFLGLFPDAKVILTVRDDEEEYVRSCVNQRAKIDNNAVLFALLSRAFRSWIRFRQAAAKSTYHVSSKSFVVIDENRMLMAQAYRRHNAYVKKCCPRDQLLVFNCKEGWGPLCHFLGVPIPDDPFPHKNIKGEFSKDYEKSGVLVRVRQEVLISITSLVFGAVVVSCLCYKYLK